MATSSIFESVKIDDPKNVEAFIKAMDAAMRDQENRPETESKQVLSDPEAIKELFLKGSNDK